jgi:hypothetical protein
MNNETITHVQVSSPPQRKNDQVQAQREQHGSYHSQRSTSHCRPAHRAERHQRRCRGRVLCPFKEGYARAHSRCTPSMTMSIETSARATLSNRLQLRCHMSKIASSSANDQHWASMVVIYYRHVPQRQGRCYSVTTLHNAALERRQKIQAILYDIARNELKDVEQ